MNLFSVKDFEGSNIDCEIRGYHVYSTASCLKFSYDFDPGIYILEGDIDSGNWAFSSALFIKNKKKGRYRLPSCYLDETTEFYYNGEQVSREEIRKHSWDLTGCKNKFFERKFDKTVRQRIENGIRENNLPYDMEKIKEMFLFDESRLDRETYKLSSNIIEHNAAIGFVDGKEIFCFPWISKRGVGPYIWKIICLSSILAKNGCIVFIPISASALADLNEEIRKIEGELESGDSLFWKDRIEEFKKYQTVIKFPIYPKFNEYGEPINEFGEPIDED